jgi:YbgC/YbaW family acyl-CoA thioester hydrolase
MPDAAPAVVRARVRWSDVDRARIVYFGAYLRWIEAAEAEFFRAVGYSYDAIEGELGIFLARVQLGMEFRRPARLDDELTCWAELQRLGASSLDFAYAIERAGERIVDATLRLAALEPGTLRPKRLAPALRRALTARVVSSERN